MKDSRAKSFAWRKEYNIETRKIWTRGGGKYQLTSFLLCGHCGDSTQECSRTVVQIQKYVRKILGPLMDRIDIRVDVPAVKYVELAKNKAGEPTALIRRRVIDAREVQAVRVAGRHDIFWNAQMGSKELREFCSISEAGAELLKTAVNRLGLSARAYHRILKVLRTIADLAGRGDIRVEHIGEVISYRRFDREFAPILKMRSLLLAERLAA